ncbi:MAG: acetylxylan esterase [Clostridia bacterium]|nr:acetylxylan esterase [Clostridia bacterium]
MTSHEHLVNVIKNITPSYRYDGKEDIAAWQSRAKAKLEELLGLPLVAPEKDMFSAEASYERDGLTFTKFTFQSEEGYFVPCCLVKKTDLKGKAPLVICLQGHSSGMHISLGEPKFEKDANSIAGGRDFAVRAAKEGCVAVAIEQRYMGVMGNPDSPVPACCAGDNQAIPAILIGRTAIGERVWDISRTIDAVLTHFADEVDENRVVCLGNSGGGTATFYASCMDERIAVSVPSCAVCTYEASIIAMNHCPCNYIPYIRKYFDMGDLGGLIAPRKLVTVCGKDDPIFPLPGVKESMALIENAYKAYGKEENCSLVIGDGGHQFYPDEAWPLIHGYLEV